MSELTPIVSMIGIVVTTISSYYYLSLSTRKNMKAQLVDKLRLEVANYIGIAMTLKKSDIEAYTALARSGKIISLMLDTRNEKQKRLYSTISELIIFEKDSHEFFDMIKTTSLIVRVELEAKEVIQELQGKI